MRSVTIGKALKRARGAKTQVEIAAALGVDQPTISRWEGDKTRPSFEEVSQVEEASGRPRGYCWIAAGFVELPTTIQEFIAIDPELEPGYAQLVLASYDAARDRSAVDRANMSAAKPTDRRS